jgi:YegS/Rv2252/BmrU family lipid kinase
MDPSNWFVIINPKAGNGTALKQWPKIQSLLIANHFSFQFEFTDNKGHATVLTIKAVNNGFEKIICIGGDGTLHAVVNGLMRQNKVESSSIPIALIPIGTGNDWAKTYKIPRTIEAAIQLLKTPNIKVQDVGKIDFLDSKKPSVYFNNLAGIGFDGLVAKKTETLKHFGKLSYLVAACQCLASFQNFEVEIIYANNRFTTQSLMVLIGLCQYSGGGMRLTNSPNASDGLFDVTNVTNFNIWNFITNLPKLYNGKIKSAKKVNTFKTNNLILLTNKRFENLYIQVDGEVVVAENISISIQKKAFSFYC